MANNSGLAELNSIFSDQNLTALYYRDEKEQRNLTFSSGIVDFDSRTLILIKGKEYYRTKPINHILVEEDTLHKTFVMESFYGERFEISVYQTVET